MNILRLKKFRGLPNVYCVVAKNQYWLTSTFLRLQEFYESPLKSVQGKHFTLETFSDLYAEKFGNFTYYSDWGGFNIPGHIVRDFYSIFTDLSLKENRLKELLFDALRSKERFYVIGLESGDKAWKITLKHELAHALYYFNEDYKREMKEQVENLHPSIRKIVFSKLEKMGYAGLVKEDELQAYMATTNPKNLKHLFGSKIKSKHTSPFQKVYGRYTKSVIPRSI